MHEVVLSFHTKKHANDLLKKLGSGKNAVVKREHVGGGWFSNLKDIGRKIAENPEVQRIAKDVGKKALDKGVEMGTHYVENKLSGGGLFGSIGNVVDEITGRGIHHKRGRKPRKRANSEEGEGLFGTIGSVVDEITGRGIKSRGRPKKIHQSRALELYQKHGGSFMPL